MKGKRHEFITLAMTRQRALELGLLVCGRCGCPENKHFDHTDKFEGKDCPCSACPKCAGYLEDGATGILLKK